MLFLCLFVGITGNNGKVREGKGMYGKGIFKAIEPPKKVSTFASIKKINVKPSEGKLTGRVLLEMKKRFFPQTLADTHKKLF